MDKEKSLLIKKLRCCFRTSLAGFITALLLAASADAATLTVTSTADGMGICPGPTCGLPQSCPGRRCTLRLAIATAASDDTITFSLPANSKIYLNDGYLLIDKNLTISGPGANLLSVQRSASAANFSIFSINKYPASVNVTISGLTIANGSSLGVGGIFNNASTVNITNSTISGNSAIQGGGGIMNYGALTITNSTISGNYATANTHDTTGSGIHNIGGTVNITNSTISGNSADYGGGIYNDGGTVNITNSTISGNAAAYGGGIFMASGTVRSRNTIISLNTAFTGADVDGYALLTSQGFNMIGTPSELITPTTGDQIGVTPAQLNLDPLQDNGGPTMTHALLSGSFAIDKGNSNDSTTDQRGFTRPVDNPAIPNATGGDGSDIGSYELSTANAYLDTVQKIYIGYYQRPADPAGLIYWAERLNVTAGNLTEIIEAYANSAESQALYGTINSGNISTVVNDIYNALFARDAEAGGLNYYVNGFNMGQFTPATIMLNVLYGAQNEDLQSVNNKLTAANLFTMTIDPDLDGRNLQATYAGDGDVIAGRNFLAFVTWISTTVPNQSQTTEYIRVNIADPGDPILTP